MEWVADVIAVVFAAAAYQAARRAIEQADRARERADRLYLKAAARIDNHVRSKGH